MQELKHYSLVTHEGFWKKIHNLLCKETKDIDFIPDRSVECYNPNDYLDEVGDYLLTEIEADNLRKHPNIKWIGLDQSYHLNPEIVTEPWGHNKRSVDPETGSLPKILRNNPRSLTQVESYTPSINDRNRTNWALKRSEESTFDFYKKASKPYTIKFRGDDLPQGLLKYQDTSNDIIIRNSMEIGRYSNSRFPSSKTNGPFLKTVIFNDITDAASFGTSTALLGKYYEWNVDSITYEKTGQNVDVIIQDTGVEQYHPEFIDRFTRTATDDPFVGRSRVRDLILDGPYYLDPVVFNSGVLKSHKTLKADGRPTCTREGAILWWSTLSNRSAEYATESIGSISNIREQLDSLKSNPDFTILPYYEESVLGGPTSPGHKPPGDGYIADKGNNRVHGSGCAGVSCGKNFGSAVDARIWSIAIITDGNQAAEIDIKTSWRAITIFHKAKKVAKDTTYAYSGGTQLNRINQSPTIVNASWGSAKLWAPQVSLAANTNQSISCARRYKGTESNVNCSLSKVNYYDSLFDANQNQFAITIPSMPKEFFVGAHSKGFDSIVTMPIDYFNSDSPDYDASLEAIVNAFISSGVIYVAAAGNYSWYSDSYNGSNYNNYFEYPIMASPTPSADLSVLSKTTKIFPNRRSYPSGVGGWDSKNNCFKSFSIGGIDQAAVIDDEIIKEMSVYWSNRGPGIDLFGFGASNCLSASTEQYQQYLNYPRFDNKNPSIPGITYFDQSFSGTSCATPIVVGVFALYLEENPSATYVDVRTWMNNTGSVNGNLFNPINNPDDPRFFASSNGLWGSPNKVIHNPYVSKRFKFKERSTALATVAESAPETVFTRAGVSKAEGVSLIKSPPDTSSIKYSTFVTAVSSVDTYIATTPSATALFKTVTSGFGGRNNGGNAKWERQVDTGNIYFAAAGGGGGGYYGGGGGNIGGGGGGGAGLAREDASDVATAQRGSNTAEGYARIWLNETADGSRASWKQRPLNR